ncbi:unnamed protein product [Heligmosomoides polygyrus]|uniref:Uncharacterized protein n=1 Tax=Heligmosomoides polygyrus TaxID=6339 RepID=A0A183F9V8_HELPZ|nr:unnamed protein product [Heligmosomoides polygyrus]
MTNALTRSSGVPTLPKRPASTMISCATELMTVVTAAMR